MTVSGPTLNLKWKSLIVLLLGLGIQISKSGDKQSTTSVKTNLHVLQDLVAAEVGEVIEHSKLVAGNRIEMKCPPADDNWIMCNSISSTLQSFGCRVFTPGDTAITPDFMIDVGGAEMRVRYEDVFRNGMFGSKKVRRTISVGVSVESMNTKTKEVLFSGFLRKEVSDTVAVDDIPTLELASAKSTHAELPPETTFDRIVEPFVIIGATGVIVYLFFHVRS
ncbi:MAG: hypothetical protein HYR76_04850 [Ignavibacteria bacterium]|nr:hypothetical protein [Ignavibacteria bacterium]